MFDEAVKVGREQYPKENRRSIKYGTAGFRDKENILDYVVYRMGILAALRSKSEGGAAIGAIITASHNPVCDNGIKLVEKGGEMLILEWEALATNLVSVPDEELGNALEKIIRDNGIDGGSPATVFVGRDTRPSSVRLQKAVVSGVTAIGGVVQDFGVVSTPVLHFALACHNGGGSYGHPSLEGYMEKLSKAFLELRSTCKAQGNYTPSILYDGAHGVGAQMFEQMVSRIKGALQVELFNKGDGILNFECGADFVKSNQQWPSGVPKRRGARCGSVDGDADRLVYSYIDSSDQYHLLDGDKIATLIAGYIKKLLKESELNLNLGIVQTAYANGASTAYINQELGVPVSFSKTGVKHLHQEALRFDIGIYFEANGHGTVIFSETAKTTIRTIAQAGNEAASRLNSLMSLINETVGDAISDLLVVETILAANGWSAEDWDKAYTDLPSTLLKVSVPDRSVIKTTNAERTCTSPEGLQEKIDALVASYPGGRAFVRPSGTEDIVRVCAEAATKLDADQLAKAVADAVTAATS